MEALMTHPAVEVAVVFGVPNEFWGEEVAAAVVLKQGAAATKADSLGKGNNGVVGMPVKVMKPSAT